MTSDWKHKEVHAYIDYLKQCCDKVMSMSDGDNFLSEEIVCKTLEQMIAQEFMKRAIKEPHFERANPPVINTDKPENVIQFRPKGV